MLLCAAALLVRLLIPAGYMIGVENGRPTIELCSGVAPSPMAGTMHQGMAGHGKKDGDRAEVPCAFGGLAIASLGAIDPVQLTALLAFVVAVALCPVTLPSVARLARLRPPLRAPPLPL